LHGGEYDVNGAVYSKEFKEEVIVVMVA